MKVIDDFLNGITMYRLMFQFLVILLIIAVAYSFLGILPFNPISLILTSLFFVGVCWVANTWLSKIFKAPTNFESVYITACILSLIISPFKSINELPIFFGIAVIAMASKYILAINKKHLFNPSAVAVALTAIFLNFEATWWVGQMAMAPWVLIGGLLIVRKIKRFSLVLSFGLVAIVLSLFQGTFYLNSPLLFLGLIMLTEPQTTPPTRRLQIIYGSLVGLFYSSGLNFGTIYATPEVSLLLGNLYSYLVSPKYKLVLKLKKRDNIAPPSIDELTFTADQKIDFQAGQYLEWTLPHPKPDTRGVRRYFTIASSPTEDDIKLGIKFYDKSSSFKTALGRMKIGDRITASQLSGEFTLPEDPSQKLVFIAGGIGVTPFRSMIQFLLDKNEKRNAILFYSNKIELDLVYQNIFDKAQKQLGIKTIYTLTDKETVPKKWAGKVGYVDANMIKKEVPDFKERIFYISGPHSMVDAFEKTLEEMGIPQSQIKIDFFPGYV